MKNLLNILMAAALLGLSGCGEKTPGAAPDAHGADEAAEESAEPADHVEISTAAQKAGGIRTETLRRTSVPRTFQALGRVMQDAQKPHHITAGAPGRLETLSGFLGQAVDFGQVLAVIRPASGPAVPASAPHKGIVTAVHAGEGDPVTEMTFLFTITAIDPLWGVLDIPERSLEQVRSGQAVEIKTAAYPGKAFKGTIAFISPEIDSVSRTIKARVSIENPGGLLKFGMFLDATVRTGAYLQGLAVRSGAVQNGPGGPFVFVKTCETGFAARPVETGREQDGLVEIIKGLVPGDKVVTEGAYLVKSEMIQGGGEAKCSD